MRGSTADAYSAIPTNLMSTAGRGAVARLGGSEYSWPHDSSFLTSATRSTLAGMALIAAASGLISMTDVPTCPEPLTSAMAAHSRIGAVLAAFDVSELDFAKVRPLLSSAGQVLPLLSYLSTTVFDVYGATATVALRSLDDPDNGNTILEARILSGLAINDEFDMKDAALFARIERSGLVDGMRHVVISQG